MTDRKVVAKLAPRHRGHCLALLKSKIINPSPCLSRLRGNDACPRGSGGHPPMNRGIAGVRIKEIMSYDERSGRTERGGIC
ncbi:MAG: hypothetical protein QME64_11125, partial [bacterium]|nr:hypothetical protein [bacterium]